MASCAVAFIKDTLAPQFGLQLNDVRAVASCNSDFGGLLGVPGARPNLADLAIEIVIDSRDDQAKVEQVSQAWLERCPIYLALLSANNVSVRFTPRRCRGVAICLPPNEPGRPKAQGTEASTDTIRRGGWMSQPEFDSPQCSGSPR